MDKSVLQRLVSETGAVLGQVYGLSGKDQIVKRLNRYNQSARRSPWVVLLDLDRDESCAPAGCRLWLKEPEPNLCFRLVVRAVEAWLLADREALAKFLRVAAARVPRNPEQLDDPKRVVVSLARHSRSRQLRADMVPEPSSGRTTGPRYAQRLTEFAEKHWRPAVAAKHADSLRRCRQRLNELVEKFS
ncbi:MAG TPA: hypothetical protein VG013_13455 [Gemmataceae bacterium]|nr:hypothetical protein [Gemmataceae bacterium]